MKKIYCMVLLLLSLAVTAGATQVDASNLEEGMSPDKQHYLEGVTPQGDGDLLSGMQTLLENASTDMQQAGDSALHSLTKIAGVVMLVACARGVFQSAGQSAQGAIELACVLGCASIVLSDFSGTLAICRQTFDEMSAFSGIMQPVLATVLSLGGNATTATVLQVATIFVFDVVIRLVTSLLVPASCAYLAVLVVQAATGNDILNEFADGIYSLTTGALKLILTLFVTYITIAGGVSGSIDKMTLKTAKFAVSGSVPVVGSIISDATETVLSGAILLKNTIGVFGMLCVTAICIIPFLRAGLSYLTYRVGSAVLSPLCSKNTIKLLSGVSRGYGLLLGLLSTCSLVLYFELIYVVAVVKLV